MPIVASLVIPIRNEEKFILACIESILSNTYSPKNYEILFVDGNSTDQTVSLIHNYPFPEANWKVLSNPQKIVPTAMNIGIREAKGQYIIRLDAHTQYDSQYIEKCIQLLESGIAENVGGAMRPVAQGYWSQGVAVATSSSFGIGNSSFHFSETEGYVETVYLGAFVKSALFEVGLYDETLVRNQDDELNLRLLKMGKRIYISKDIISYYTPRNSVKGLFKQYFEYGYWKVRVIQKHRSIVSLRHLVPVTLVLALLISGLGIFISEKSAWFFSAFLGIYVFAICFFSLGQLFQKQSMAMTSLFIIYPCLHLSYGLGFLLGLLKAPFYKKVAL